VPIACRRRVSAQASPWPVDEGVIFAAAFAVGGGSRIRPVPILAKTTSGRHPGGIFFPSVNRLTYPFYPIVLSDKPERIPVFTRKVDQRPAFLGNLLQERSYAAVFSSRVASSRDDGVGNFPSPLLALCTGRLST
jgi:hypothetical protein